MQHPNPALSRTADPSFSAPRALALPLLLLLTASLLCSPPTCFALHPTPSADLLPFAADDDMWAEGLQDGRKCRLLCIADAVLVGCGRNMGRKCQIAWVFFNTN